MKHVYVIRRLGGRRHLTKENFEVSCDGYFETRTFTMWGAKLEVRRRQRKAERNASSKEVWRTSGRSR